MDKYPEQYACFSYSNAYTHQPRDTPWPRVRCGEIVEQVVCFALLLVILLGRIYFSGLRSRF
jgi:hypothetical protein